MNIVKHTFVAASLLCGAAYLTKIALIAAADGGDSTLISALWVVGTVTFLVASALGAALLLRSRAVWMRVIAAVVAVPVAFIVFNLVDSLTKSLYKTDGWFRDELSLVIIGVVVAAIGLRVLAGGATRGSTDHRLTRTRG